tara:strand:+ start:4403 stop:6568 length:2166 start_codon:yes stop_codon:yes gene_type:complete
MKNLFLILAILFKFSLYINAQNSILDLNDIWNSRKYQADYLWGYKPLNDGVHFTSLNYKKNKILITKYDYFTGDSIKNILNSKDIDELKFDDYEFSPNESKILLSTQTESIYRYSKKSNYYIYDIDKKSIENLSSGKQNIAIFSPDNKNISYVFENNIYIKNLESNNIIQITNDGEKNVIINGSPDWVYEEEFMLKNGIYWNKSGSKLAYFKFNEKEVKEFSMDIYDGLYPSKYKFKYPKAGEKNSKVEIHVYDLAKNISKKINLKDKSDFYIPRIKWTNNDELLMIEKLNRHQNKLELILHNVTKNKITTILTEKDDAYIEIHDNLEFISNDNNFIWTSEKSGYNHIYYYDIKGRLLNKITKGNFDIDQFYGYDNLNNKIFYRSSEASPLRRDIYSIETNGKNKTKISQKIGFNDAYFSKNFNFLINEYSNANSPYEFDLLDSKGNFIRNIIDNERLKNELENSQLSKKEFFKFTNSSNIDLNGWIIKPPNFNETKKYPVFMYLYGGPGSQQVLDSWGGYNFLWFQMLAKEGYIVACVDNRGTGGRGSDFKKCTYLNLGKLETKDQIDANKFLSNLSYVDSSRIGIFGWSYGGYMSSLCLFKGSDIFKMGIAVAPVTNWRYYDSIYTERYMRTPKENSEGYDLNSPINFASKLKGKYLLIHGSADDNVHYQNSMELADELIKSNKQFEFFVYPNKNHGIYGGSTRFNLYTKMTNFIKNNL